MNILRLALIAFLCALLGNALLLPAAAADNNHWKVDCRRGFIERVIGGEGLPDPKGIDIIPGEDQTAIRIDTYMRTDRS